MKRMIGACAVAVLAFGSLTACGGGSDDSSATASDTSSSDTGDNGGGIFGGGGTDDYCSALQDAKQQFGGDVEFDPKDLGDAVNTIHNIAGQAPDSVSAEWATIDDAFSQLISALADVGLDPSDLGDPTAMQSLASDPQKLQELENITKSFDSKALTQAGNKIDAEVKADCGFALSSSN
jgi:ABC-type glycerol-3-phosphate transport system substrate-binding protein